MPGGSFIMGSSPADLKRAELLCQQEAFSLMCNEEDVRRSFLAEAPAHEVTLSPYAIDRTEVTVRAYTRCVEAGVCAPPARGSHDARFDRPDLPVTYVDWDAATTFCAWSGGRLPTEAEWEFAARGPEERQYPWGNVYNPLLCNHGAFAADRTDATDGFVGLAPVGTYLDGATPLGVLDLAGNVAEWVYDRFDPDPQLGFGYEPASRVNPKGPRSGALHVIRGGSYLKGAPWVRGAARDGALGPSPIVGFRCAADVR
jgi:formylglycine-generating enzyme required for sulfatase activity